MACFFNAWPISVAPPALRLSQRVGEF